MGNFLLDFVFFFPFQSACDKLRKETWDGKLLFHPKLGLQSTNRPPMESWPKSYKTASPLPPPPIKDHLATTTSFSSLYRQLTKVTAKSGQLLKPHHKWPLTLWISWAQPSYIEKPQKWPLGFNQATFWATYQTKSLLAVCDFEFSQATHHHPRTHQMTKASKVASERWATHQI
jgi:hypothetical protein